MHVLRHEEFNDGCEAECNGDYDQPWSKTMVGFGPEHTHFALELTYNYGLKTYTHGNDLAWIGLYVPAAINRLKQVNWPLQVAATHTEVLSPDGNRFRFFHSATDLARPHNADPFRAVCLHVSDLTKADAYWARLGLQHEAWTPTQMLAYFDRDQCKLVLCAHTEPIIHAAAYGRIAFATSRDIHTLAATITSKIHTPPVTLTTPGKAEVEVVILQDPDDYEICFVGATGFEALSTPTPQADFIDWAQRHERGAD